MRRVRGVGSVRRMRCVVRTRRGSSHPVKADCISWMANNNRLCASQQELLPEGRYPRVDDGGRAGRGLLGWLLTASGHGHG